MRIVVWSKGAQGGRGMQIEEIYEGQARSVFTWARGRARSPRFDGSNVRPVFEVQRAPDHSPMNAHLAGRDYLNALAGARRA